jgi:hypothetical protein
VGKKTRRKQYFEYLVKWKTPAGKMRQAFRSMDRPCRSSWTGAHENFEPRSMMQEHPQHIKRANTLRGTSWTSPTHILKYLEVVAPLFN